MARQSFPYTTFTTPTGDPLSEGFILIYVADDAKSPDGLLCRGMTLRVELDENGAVVSVPQVWPTDVLEPSGVYYVLTSYTRTGELVVGPLKVEVESV